jgi:hypothetical protein
MKKEKTYLRLTIILPILFGIILPLALYDNGGDVVEN